MNANRLFLFAIPVMAFLAPVYLATATLRLPHDGFAIGVAGAIVILAILIGALAAALYSERARRGRTIVLAGLLGLVALLTLDLSLFSQKVALFTSGRADVYAAIVLLWVCLAATFWLLRRHAPRILFIGALAMLVATIVTNPILPLQSSPSPPPQEGQSSDQPVVYVILDEMIGLEGIPRDLPGGEEIYGRIRHLFESHGFRLYGRAFSRHVKSVRSIPDTLNFDDTDESWGTTLRYAHGDVVQSALLRQMAAERPLTIYQTDHIDFCSSIKDRCETLRSFDVRNGFVDSSTFGAGAQLQILRKAVEGSALATATIDLLAQVRGVDVKDPILPDFFDSYAFAGWFDKFTDDVASSGGHSNFFAHVLAPHSPYVLSAGCEPQHRLAWPYNLTETYGLTGADLDAARRQHYGWYIEQVSCLVGHVEALITAIDRAPGLERATIVFHGDHGSRISAGERAEFVSDRDLLDNYSALYAIRAAGVEPGYDERVVSVQRLTAEYFDPAVPPEDPSLAGTVVIDTTRNGEIERRALPARFLDQPDATGDVQSR